MSLADATSAFEALIESHGARMLDLAAASIRHGLERGSPLPVDPRDHPPALAERGACFVTLHRDGALRGCIGSARAWRPLALDVSVNAVGAAFEDPRFDPVSWGEIDALDIDISILGPASPMSVASEAELIAALRPGRDGVILSDGERRGLFLPAVWESVSGPADFVDHLKLKAGIARWSPRTRAERFETRAVSRKATRPD
jgi:AmmeMemoRadiSam system protein A